MSRIESGLKIAVAWLALGASCAALAQEGGNVIGPPQLRDFSLEPQNRVVVPPPGPAPTPQTQAQQQPQPQAQPSPPVRVAPPPPAVTAPSPGAAQRPAPAQPRSVTPPPVAPPPPAVESPSAPSPEVSSSEAAIPQPDPAPVSPPSIPDAADADAPAAEGTTGVPIWMYGIALLLALLGAAWFFRRRRAGEADEMADAPTSARAATAVAPGPARPRPEPGMRPWLELELRTERASFTDAEASVNFELEIRNSGKSPAKNLRIDVKLFNGSEQQDKEIGAFFRTAGRETTRLNLPAIAAGQSGVIKGEVGIPRDQIRALRLDDRMLFIPVVAVNALYDCDDGRTGQTSRSYIVGRELQAQGDRMGAFRVDQGPRIWRTVGQRPHTLARRV